MYIGVLAHIIDLYTLKRILRLRFGLESTGRDCDTACAYALPFDSIQGSNKRHVRFFILARSRIVSHVVEPCAINSSSYRKL